MDLGDLFPCNWCQELGICLMGVRIGTGLPVTSSYTPSPPLYLLLPCGAVLLGTFWLAEQEEGQLLAEVCEARLCAP